MSTLAVKCKFEGDEALVKTLQAFADACNRVVPVAHELRTTNKFKLQKATYETIRQETGLTANLTIRTIARVCATLKINWNPIFRPTSMDYDARVFSFREEDWSVSLSTLEGRRRYALKIGNYQRHLLKDSNPTAATVVRNRKGQWYIHIVVEREDLPASGSGAMGVDLGIRNVATTSTGKIFSGKSIQAQRNRFHHIRASLQSKGTKGAKQLLKQLSGKERRQQAAVNHVLAKKLVQEAINHNVAVIRFEDLKGIRSRTKIRSKHFNRMINFWSFGQLQGFVAYKAQAVGISVEFVDPCYTSQNCHLCGSRGKRKGDIFSCPACGDAHADENAAMNIKAGGVEAGVIPAHRNATRISGKRPPVSSQLKATGIYPL